MQPNFNLAGKAIRRNLDGDEDPQSHQKDAAERQWRVVLLQFWRGQLARIEKKLEPGIPKSRKAIEDLPKRLDKSFWDDENWLLLAEILPLLSDVATEAALFSAEAIEGATGLGVDWTLINTAAAKWAGGYAGDLVKGITKTTRGNVGQHVTEFVETPGMTIGDLRRKLATLPAFNDNRARMVAVTEVTRAVREGNLATARTYEAEGLFTWERTWHTNMDSLVCFPAWTMVETKGGLIPIQKLRLGMMVLTRRGYRPIQAISRRNYSGDMVRIKTERHEVVSTGGHPYWISKQGWLEGRNIALGQILESFGKEPIRVLSISKFNVGDAANIPATGLQVTGFAGISGSIFMPIDTINFKGNPEIAQEKINAIPAHTGLLDISNTKLIEQQPDLFFWQCFTLKRAVASKGAKLPICIAGQFSKFNTAISAIDGDRWAATFFRAETREPSAFTRLKFLVASFTDICLKPKDTTFFAAIRKAMGNTFAYLKCFAASRANLNNPFGPQRNLPTFSIAKAAALRDLTDAFIGQFAANGTGDFSPRFGSGMVTFIGTKDSFARYAFRARERLTASITNVFKGHGAHLLTRLNVLYHKWAGTSIPVYNIQVSDEPEFYANGVLVHNCELCAPLDGKKAEGLDGEYLFGGEAGPPRHPRCRCWETLKPIIGEA